MIHRTTALAVPVITLVVFSAGLGWWGAEQHRQNQAAVQFSSNQIAQSLHGLKSDVDALRQQADEAIVSTDRDTFAKHAQQIWQWSDRAQEQLARLPVNAADSTHIHAFLVQAEQRATTWMNSKPNPQNPAIRRQTVQLSDEAEAIANAFSSTADGAFPLHITSATMSGEADQSNNPASVSTLLNRLNTVAARLSEPQAQTGPHTGKSSPFANEAKVTAARAKLRLTQFIGESSSHNWTVRSSQHTTLGPSYTFEGTGNEPSEFAIVSQQGGHVLSMHITRQTNASKLQDLTMTQRAAIQWLNSRGFSKLSLMSSQEIDGMAYFTLVPTLNGLPILNQPIHLSMTMDSHQVGSFDARSFYGRSVNGSLPKPQFSLKELQRRVSNVMRVQDAQAGVLVSDDNQPIPVDVFYGTAHDKSFKLVLNAANGSEIGAERLS